MDSELSHGRGSKFSTRGRAVHGLGLCPTRTWPECIGWMKSLTRNWPGSCFGSTGSGCISFGSISVGFRFAGVEQNLPGFWLKYCLISLDLVGSNEIWPIFPYIYKYRAEILMDLAEICLSYGLGLDLLIFGRVCNLPWGKNSSSGGSSSLVSQTTNPQLEPMVSGASAGDPRPTVNKLWSGGFGWRWSSFGRFGWVGRVFDSLNSR